MILDEVHAIRAHATSAHLMQGPEGMGACLHATLQELRMLKNYQDKMIKNHHLVRGLHGDVIVQHLHSEVGVGFNQIEYLVVRYQAQ